jgi:hypothetical protein
MDDVTKDKYMYTSRHQNAGTCEKKYSYKSRVWVRSTHLFGVQCSKLNYSHEKFGADDICRMPAAAHNIYFTYYINVCETWSLSLR